MFRARNSRRSACNKSLCQAFLIKRRKRENSSSVSDSAQVQTDEWSVLADGLHAQAAKGYTIIYATKEGEVAPTPEEAVAHWESGFEKLESVLKLTGWNGTALMMGYGITPTHSPTTASSPFSATLSRAAWLAVR